MQWPKLCLTASFVALPEDFESPSAEQTAPGVHSSGTASRTGAVQEPTRAATAGPTLASFTTRAAHRLRASSAQSRLTHLSSRPIRSARTLQGRGNSAAAWEVYMQYATREPRQLASRLPETVKSLHRTVFVADNQ